MLFNSYEFLFAFFPITYFTFFFLAQFGQRFASTWLLFSSIAFYGWWNPTYVLLLIASIVFNFSVGNAILSAREKNSRIKSKHFLWFGITSNLLLLGYYKYANFVADTSNLIFENNWTIEQIVLPLGISFYTFTQIAYLVDAFRGEVREKNFIHYGLFVTYFPHLIAGPVLHHKEMMPQFRASSTYRINWENIAIGSTIFIIGLFKKLILADGISVFVAPVFEAAQSGTLGVIEAWCGALAYTLQLYFDFSGYSDMAIGISRMFGVRLPLNFDSPYKSASIIDFWRRWHITLSRFLRDYLYFSLGGNRHGKARRYINLFATMVLGGLWHGAGWTFIAWGAIHGVYLTINHIWRTFRRDFLKAPEIRFEQTFYKLLTFLSVVFAWVFFRSNDIDSALNMIQSMLGKGPLNIPENWPYAWHTSTALQRLSIPATLGPAGIPFDPHGTAIVWISTLLFIVFFLPNTQQIMATGQIQFKQRIFQKLSWRPTKLHAIAAGSLMAIAFLHLNRVSEFLYFQF